MHKKGLTSCWEESKSVGKIAHDLHSLFMARRVVNKLLIEGMLLVSFVSCKKDREETFSFGNIEDPGLNVAFPDTVFPSGTATLPAAYTMDVDKDGVNDFQFLLTEVKLDDAIHYSRLEIACLTTESFLGVKTLSDTTFINSWTSSNNNGQGKKETAMYRYYYHVRQSSKDSIGEIHKIIYAVPFKKHDLPEAVNWFSDTCLLVRTGYSLYFVNYESGPDWIRYRNEFYDSFHLFPDKQIRYIGIKKKVNGKDKLGWIKLFLTGPIVSILEVALQK